MKAKSRFEAVLATAIACVCVVCADAAEQIGLSVLHFRPLDAELNKFLKPVQRKSVNSEPMKLTPQEMACLDSQDATALKLANFWERMQARTLLPSARIMQAPQAPSLHPSLTEVR